MLLDLRHVRWLEPLHVVAAAAYAQRAHAEGSWLELAKVDPSSATYAARMGLGDVIDSYGGRHNLPPSMNARNRGDTLLEVRRAADARHWAELVHERSFGTAGAAAGPLFTGLAELGEDIILHSGTEGFVAAQTYQDARLIRFPVADAGVGLRTTLAGRGATSDYHALHLALTGTSRLDGARLRDADHLGTDPQHRGSMVLGSGCAVAMDETATRHLPNAFPGTIFEGCVPATPPSRRDDGPYPRSAAATITSRTDAGPSTNGSDMRCRGRATVHCGRSDNQSVIQHRSPVGNDASTDTSDAGISGRRQHGHTDY